MVNYVEKDELYIVTENEMLIIKQNAIKLLNVLPKDPKTAMVMITFLKQHMEETLDIKVKGMKIIN